MAPDPVRRVVTGHSPAGDAIIESDQHLEPHDALDPSSPATPATTCFSTIWRTTSFPADVQGPWSELHGTSIPLADKVGTTVRIVDFPPGQVPMHRTLSIDFGIVLEGEVELELDHGVKTLLKKDDIVVQRGTIHSWRNAGEGVARMIFVLVPAEPVKIGDKVLEEAWVPLESDNIEE